jgi:hypothetical protein
LGVPDRIRVPRPAAMMRTVNGSGICLGGYRRELPGPMLEVPLGSGVIGSTGHFE